MSRRTDRLNELLRQELSQVLQRKLRDPRLAPLVSIVRVETSADLRQARVFISVMGSRSDKDEALQALTSATGFMKRELSQVLSMRRLPELSFVLDETIEQAADVLKMMDQLVSERSQQRPV